MSVTLNPYLNFDGNAAEAIELYKRVLGAEADSPMRFGDYAEMKAGPEDKDRILHAALRIGHGMIMVSDIPKGMPFSTGGNVEVCLHFTNADDAAKKFEALAEGGSVSMPFADAFWGAKFGSLTDRFGVRWMFHCETKK